jgi:hypothetical protein
MTLEISSSRRYYYLGCDCRHDRDAHLRREDDPNKLIRRTLNSCLSAISFLIEYSTSKNTSTAVFLPVPSIHPVNIYSQITMGDGVFLVNCTNGNDKRSAVAFYNNISPIAGGNDGQQPDAFQYISFGSFASFEGDQGGCE